MADDRGLLQAEPFAELHADLQPDLSGHPHAHVLWDGILRARGEGRLRSAEEARGLLHHLVASIRPGRVTLLVGPSGSGKSTWTRGQGGRVLSLDDLRTARGDRSDQSHNAAILRGALDALLDGLRTGEDITWDATSLTRRQRALVLDKALRYAVPTRIVCLLTPEPTLQDRNRNRLHPVPESVLAAQCRSVEWPLASEAHEVLDVGPTGTFRFGGWR